MVGFNLTYVQSFFEVKDNQFFCAYLILLQSYRSGVKYFLRKSEQQGSLRAQF